MCRPAQHGNTLSTENVFLQELESTGISRLILFARIPLSSIEEAANIRPVLQDEGVAVEKVKIL